MGLKSYLSADDRKDFIKLYHLKDHGKEFIARQHKYGNLTPIEFDHFTKGIAFLESGCQSMIKRLDERSAHQLVKDNENTKLFFLPKYDADKKEKEFFESLPDTIPVKQSALYDLACYALGQCNNPCEHKDPGTCHLKEIFMTLDIPMINEEADVCPYIQLHATIDTGKKK